MAAAWKTTHETVAPENKAQQTACRGIPLEPEHPLSRQEKEGSNQMKRGNEEFGIVQRSNEINQWLHHVLDLPCWSNWWPPSSIVRINSLTITNVTLRVYNYLEHCFHEDRLPSLDELISCQSIVISTRLFLSIQIHKISRSCLDVTRIFYIASRNFVALDRFSTLFLLFIFIFFFFFFKLTRKPKRSRVSSRRKRTSRSWLALSRVNHMHLPPA